MRESISKRQTLVGLGLSLLSCERPDHAAGAVPPEETLGAVLAAATPVPGWVATPWAGTLAGWDRDDSTLGFEWEVLPSAQEDLLVLHMEGQRLLGFSKSCAATVDPCRVPASRRAAVLGEIMTLVAKYEVDLEPSIYFRCVRVAKHRCLSMFELYLGQTEPYAPDWTIVVTESGAAQLRRAK